MTTLNGEFDDLGASRTIVLATYRGNLPKTWETKDGDEIRIRDMSDRHLLFALRKLEEKKRDYRPSRYDFETWLDAQAFLVGEEALNSIGDWPGLDDYDEEIQYDSDTNYPYNSHISAMLREAARRKLKALPLRERGERSSSEIPKRGEYRLGEHGPICVCDECM